MVETISKQPTVEAEPQEELPEVDEDSVEQLSKEVRQDIILSTGMLMKSATCRLRDKVENCG